MPHVPCHIQYIHDSNSYIQTQILKDIEVPKRVSFSPHLSYIKILELLVESERHRVNPYLQNLAHFNVPVMWNRNLVVGDNRSRTSRRGRYSLKVCVVDTAFEMYQQTSSPEGLT